jgi:hypothetical protein
MRVMPAKSMEAWTQELRRLSSLFADRMQDGDKVIACRSDVASPVLCIADKRADKIFQFLRMAPGIRRRSREGVARDRMLVPIQPEPGPARGEWIAAYRRWVRGRWGRRDEEQDGEE